MSKPFFIWTMRRTGGTSLTTLLTKMSEYRGLEHEPFNSDRELGNFIKDFRKSVSTEELIEELNSLFKGKPLIKHCYEMFGLEFNKLIIESISNYDYCHIFLMRKDDIPRIMSLFLAMQTSIWGVEQKKAKYQKIQSGEILLRPFDIDNMMKHYKWSSSITNKIQQELKDRNIGYRIVFFDDIYTGKKQDRIAQLYDLFDYLEFDESVKEEYSSFIDEKIFNNSQNSKSILKYIPNYDKAYQALLSVKQRNI